MGQVVQLLDADGRNAGDWEAAADSASDDSWEPRETLEAALGGVGRGGTECWRLGGGAGTMGAGTLERGFLIRL